MKEYLCPNGCNLRGAQIPPEDIADRLYGYIGEEERFFSKKIGIEIQGVYDGVLFWMCPECGIKWNRWNPKTEMWHLAEKYMANEKVEDEDCLPGLDGT